MNGEYSKYNFPFPHVFGLRRLRNAIRLVRFGYNSSTGRVVLRVAPISPFPLCTMFEGTHGDRVAGDNTDAIDFVAIASSLRATNGWQALGNTNRLKAVPLRFVRQAVALNTAHSLVLFVKFGAPLARRLAARVPSTKGQIPYISAPQQVTFITNTVF